MSEDKLSHALVVGAGIAGMKAAIELAEGGYGVYLIDSSPALGGILSKLDHQFPNNHCGICRMLPVWERDRSSEYCMRKGLFHENIRIMPLTELTGLSGEPGRFEAEITRSPGGVDPLRCIGCDRCVEACPVESRDEFNEGLSFRKAVHRAVPHNLPFSYTIDFKSCTRCGKCEEACPTGAVDLSGETSKETLEVGAVILAAGCSIYNPSEMEVYNYKEWPEVVTALELERMLSPGGPVKGRMSRFSDSGPIGSIAWIQCVGSRNRRFGQDYCSSICCMFALKEAMLVKERHPDVETAVFYMDMRAYGKEGYLYQEKARDLGVEWIRGRVSALERGADRRIYIKYWDKSGGLSTRTFDLAVLSTGQESSPELQRLSEIVGIELNDHGFFRDPSRVSGAESRPGIYWCGSSTGLKEISETVVQAQSAAMSAAGHLRIPPRSEETGSAGTKRDIGREEPRTLMMMCSCFGRQKNELPWEEIQAALTDRPGLEIIETDRICTPEGYADALRSLEGSGFNRLLVAACRPYLYDPRLRRLPGEKGIPGELVDVVDLRSVALGSGHPGDKRQVAKSMLSAALNRLNAQDVVSFRPIPVEHDLLVVGGGISGMEAALGSASQGITVWLVEKSGELGGEVLNRRFTIEGGSDPRALIREMKGRVEGEPRIHLLLGAELLELNGEPGRFRALVRHGAVNRIIPCGAAILATGGCEADPPGGYWCGGDPRIIRQGGLESLLAESPDPKRFARVAMIQCAGSRDEKRPYCSRICCASALKNAIRIKKINPDARVLILYRDMMSYGFLESYYREAREKGIQFITYDPDRKPEVRTEDGHLKIAFHEPVLDEAVEMEIDLVVLSTGVVPFDQRDLSARIGVEIDANGFFQEKDVKWRPVDLSRPGVFSCGLSKAPCNMAEALLQAGAASVRAVNLLHKTVISPSRGVSGVRQSICSVCENCIKACPFEARVKEEGRIKVIGSACQGCGICVAACPNGAAWIPASTDKQTMSVLEGLLEDVQCA